MLDGGIDAELFVAFRRGVTEGEGVSTRGQDARDAPLPSGKGLFSISDGD